MSSVWDIMHRMLFVVRQRWSPFLLSGLAGLVSAYGIMTLSGTNMAVEEDWSVVNGTELDFGDMRQDEVKSAQFILRNSSAFQMKILEIRSSCTCTVPENCDGITKGIVQPNQEVVLPVIVNTGSRQGDFVAKVDVLYQRGGRRELGSLTLGLLGRIIPEVQVSPAEISFGVLDDLMAVPVTRDLIVQRTNDQVELIRVTPSDERLSVKVVEQNAAGPEVRLQVALDPGRFDDNEVLRESLTLITSSDRIPKFSVAVKGRFTKSVTAEPTAVVLRLDNTRTSSVASFCIRTSVPSNLVGLTVTPEGHGQFADQPQQSSASTVHKVEFRVDDTLRRSLDMRVDAVVSLTLGNGETTLRSIAVPIHTIVASSRKAGH